MRGSQEQEQNNPDEADGEHRPTRIIPSSAEDPSRGNFKESRKVKIYKRTHNRSSRRTKTEDTRPIKPGARPRKKQMKKKEMQARRMKEKTSASSTDKTNEQNKQNTATGSATIQKERERERRTKQGQQSKNQQAKTRQTKRQARKGQRPAGKPARKTPHTSAIRRGKTRSIRYTVLRRRI